MDCFRDTAFCTLEFKCSSFLNLLLFKIIGDVQMTGQDLLWGKLRLKYPYNQCLATILICYHFLKAYCCCTTVHLDGVKTAFK